jgi:hypothetical protein
MARLTTFSRLLLTLGIVLGIFFGVRYFLPNLGKSGGASNAQTEQPAANPGGESSSPAGNEAANGNESTAGQSSGAAQAKSAGATFTPTPFSYTPPAISGGKLRAVVELGATGFNSFIIRMDAAKNWKLEKAEFGASLVKEGLATDEDVKNGLKRYIADMLSFGVGSKDIHFVISSGAKKSEITDKIMAELKKMNYFVNVVTAEQEAKLALRASIPAAFQSRGFVVDIGSGNTKISWYSGGSSTGLEGYGSKYFQDNVSDEAAYNDTRSKASRVPAGQRATCFIIGGVPYELAKQHRVGKERYTLLKAPGSYTADGAKQKCGLNVYSAIADATGCKQFVFDWDANFTIGFLLNL